MEMIALALVALLAYNLSSKQGGVAAGIPLLGTLALGGFRLLPALQMSYASWSNLQANRVVLREVIDLLSEPAQVNDRDISREVKFSESIVLEDVSFRYEESAPYVLDHVNISIKKGSKIGLLGETGCGKSTLLDLIMGLLDPTSGQLLIDGRRMEPDSVRLWRRRIAHVPQEVFLSDNSFAENIAFGVPDNSIDYGRLREVAKTACILEFIENQRTGFGEQLGERGVRLSGGQRQRIGIARALYRNPDVLILDEATNALDRSTEIRVMEGVSSLDSGVTLVVVSHRRSTLDYCDETFRVANGAVALSTS
jgi:ABC-type bacteriocin/lantibiotic exporter with double-glycine peptidase domain